MPSQASIGVRTVKRCIHSQPVPVTSKNKWSGIIGTGKKTKKVVGVYAPKQKLSQSRQHIVMSRSTSDKGDRYRATSVEGVPKLNSEEI